jgi:hypothetical protein
VGISVWSKGSIVESNRVYNGLTNGRGYVNSPHGIDIEAYGNCTIISNFVWGVRRGIFVLSSGSSNHVLISSNTIYDYDLANSYQYAIYIDGNSYNTVSNNKIWCSKDHAGGISIGETAQSNQSLVYGNYITVRASGVWVATNSCYNSIFNNYIIAGLHVNAGVNIGAGCVGNVISENIFIGSTSSVSDSGTSTFYGLNLWHDGTYDNTKP